MVEADLIELEPETFREFLSREQAARFDESLDVGRRLLGDRTLWHVNSTMTGGGVAELLGSVTGYLLGAGIRNRWMVIEGTDDFFLVTKRIHHMLHGKDGDGGGLGAQEAELYDSVLDRERIALARQVCRGDVVVLHDPQAAGLAPALRELGATVIWNCHVGADQPNQRTRQAWRFLLPSVSKTQAQVFSRRQYVWEGLESDQVEIIPPCIDAFSPKNQRLDPAQVDAILASTGIVASEPQTPPDFSRQDGRAGQVLARTELIGAGPIPTGVPVVTQISRWDPLKDHSGVALGFSKEVPSDAHLVLAGPAPKAVTDDPEGEATLQDLRECVESLPADVQERVHIACLPMDDVEENAAIVNALQRHSRVVAQKSLAEGFGLTVAEAMWKARPTVASAVGGIQDQITDGSSGILIKDPEDIVAFGRSVSRLLVDHRAARDIGNSARSSVIDDYLAPTYLRRYLSLIQRLLEA